MCKSEIRAGYQTNFGRVCTKCYEKFPKLEFDEDLLCKEAANNLVVNVKKALLNK